MSVPATVKYVDAKAQVIRDFACVMTFVRVSDEYQKDTAIIIKYVKVGQMFTELQDIRRAVENDIQIMKSAGSADVASTIVIDNICSNSLVTLPTQCTTILPHSLTSKVDLILSNTGPINGYNSLNNLSMFQLPKRKFPTFSGKIVV